MKNEKLTKQAAVKPASLFSTSKAGHDAATPLLFRKLLVAIDFSANSREAMHYALSLAEPDHAEIHLVFVIEPLPAFSGLAQMPIVLSEDKVRERCEARLAVFAQEFASAEIIISREVRAGRPAHEIIKSAKERVADLIVIPTHGHTGLKHILLGSVAERVMREAACPVLVIRNSKACFAPAGNRAHLRKILVPTDFSPRSAAALEYAVDFATHFGGQITLLHCIEKVPDDLAMSYAAYDLEMLARAIAERADRGLANQVERIPAEVIDRSVALDGPPLSEIPKFAKGGEFDLIICATHGYTGLAHVLLGSTAEGIVRHAHCPVLIYGKRVANRKCGGTVKSGAYQSIRGKMLLYK